MSSFDSKDLFGSGPHRFAIGRRGQLITNRDFGGAITPNWSWLGLVDLQITVRGRLVAASEFSLRVLRNAVADELTDPPATGQLRDGLGGIWDGMSFVRYDEGDRRDRGRVFSIEYTALFHRFVGGGEAEQA